MDEFRRNPERILQEIQREDERKKRGHLKIFFGYAAGVGKTYAMLQAAHEVYEKGVDVVCGYIEPHARPETTALIEGLPEIPVKQVPYKDIVLRELDIDAVIARHPQIVLVDELAHTNAPGSRHNKRYQDVEEILADGIDVYTTVNVQHIESLNDMVSSITGIVVRERIPDSVFDEADQVELVDIEPNDLLERLRSGKIYSKDAARQALRRFFTVENLTALREIALRRCADRVNRRTEEARIRRGGDYHTDEHILVGLSSSPSNPKIIRTAARMAQAFHGAFTALFVETPDMRNMSEDDKKRLEASRRLAVELGARCEIVYGSNIPLQIAEFARLSGVSKIVVGRSAARQTLFGKPPLTEQLIEYAPNLDIHIIPDQLRPGRYQPERRHFGGFGTAADYGKSLGLMAAATAAAFGFESLGLTESNIVTVYILTVLLISVVTANQFCSLVFSVLSVLIFNFFFTEPRYTLMAVSPGDPVTFVVMFLSAFISGSLASRLRAHAGQSAQTAYRTRLLFDTDQMLLKAKGQKEILSAAASQLMKLLHKDIVTIVPREKGPLDPEVLLQDPMGDARVYTSDHEKSVASWVMKNNQPAGQTTNTLVSARCLYLPVYINNQVYAVVGIGDLRKALNIFDSGIVQSILGECALALENDKNAREKEAAAVLAKNEKLRANLLRSISHDLRTPLTSISGNASSLLSNAGHFDETTKHRMYTDIYEDSMWLINLVENLLSATRIEEGRMKINKSAQLLDEVLEEALKHVDRKSTEHHITTHVGDLLLAKIDPRLIVQVFINIIDNAIKYTPKGSHISIVLKKEGKWIVTSIADDGPGIPDSFKAHAFDMFATGTNRVDDSRRSLGLGLALCQSIINAHGGTIKISDNVPHGAVFTFTLPAEEVQIHE